MAGLTGPLDSAVAEAQKEYDLREAEFNREWCATLIWPRLRRAARRLAKLRFAQALHQPQAIIFLARTNRRG